MHGSFLWKGEIVHWFAVVDERGLTISISI